MPERARREAAFQQALRDLSYIEGQTITFEYRYDEGRFNRLPDLAADLVRLHVDVIVAGGTERVAGAQQATQTIAIVMTRVGDPAQHGWPANINIYLSLKSDYTMAILKDDSEAPRRQSPPERGVISRGPVGAVTTCQSGDNL